MTEAVTGSLRLIQAGLGPWGRSWAGSVLANAPGVEVVAWADPAAEARELTRELVGAPPDRFHPSVGDALATVDADAVLITSGIATHPPVAIAALRAGLHVLVEKPFAPTVTEAAEVVAEAARRDLVVAVAQNYRFFATMRALADLVRGGTLGAVDRVRLDFRKNHPGSGPSPLSREIIAQLSIHHLDLMRAVLGQEPRRVACRSWTPPWHPDPVPVSVAAVIEFDAGTVVSYTGSRVSTGPATPWAGEWHLECQRGEVVAGDTVEVRPLGEPSYHVPLPPPPWRERDALLADFVAAVHHARPPACPGHDNVRTVALLEAARTSAATGTTVPVPLA